MPDDRTDAKPYSVTFTHSGPSYTHAHSDAGTTTHTITHSDADSNACPYCSAVPKPLRSKRRRRG